jgi:hypothetical protein
MISWQSVTFNGFWILGLALILAALSYHYWLTGQENRQLRLQLSEGGFLKPLWLGLVFIGIGLIGTSQQSWEMALWGILTLIALVYLIGLFR